MDPAAQDPGADERRGGAVASDLGILHRFLLAATGALVAVEAIAYVTGWELLTRVQPTWPKIYPYTIAGLAALVIAMVLYARGGRGGRIIGRVLAGFVVLLGAAVDTLVALDLLPNADPTAADLSVATAIPSLATMAIGLSVVMLGDPADRWPRVRFWLAAFAGLCTLLGLLSYVYRSAPLFHALGLTGTSFVTTVLGLLVIGAALTARPDRPPLAALDEHYDAGLLRRLLPPLLAVPFLPAFIEWAVKLVNPDDESAEAISYLLTVVIIIVIIVVAGGAQSRARRELESERQRLWDAFATTPAATAMLGRDGRVLLANDAMGRLLDRPSAVGSMMIDLVAPPDRAAVAEGLAEVIWGLDVVRLDVQLLRPDGGTVWVDLGAAAVRDIGGTVTHVVVQCSDLTDRKHLERVLSDQATIDPLTGLLNREGLARRLNARASTADAPALIVIYADVDGLKHVNDTIGHAAGDDLLAEVARRLSSAAAESDIVARVGGDEFLVVTEASSVGQPALLERFRKALVGNLSTRDAVVAVSVSLGAAPVDSADDLANAVARADEQMYADKRLRRPR